MSVLDFAADYFPRNAITTAELIYQRRSSPRQRRWLRWIWHAVLIAGITMSMILFWGEFTGALLQRDAGPIGDRLQIGVIALIGLAFIYHFGLMFQTLSLSANSIARERENNTWEMIVLTGIDARQIVRGKWWATVQRQWHSYLLLGLIRAGAIVWWGAFSGRLMLMNYTGGYYYPYYVDQSSMFVVYPSAWQILFAGVVVFLLTMLNLGVTAACGVQASLETRRSALALARAIALRIVLLLLASLMSVLGLFALAVAAGGLSLFGSFSNAVGGGIGALMDNGLAMVSNFASIQIGFRDSPYGAISTTPITMILSALVSIGLYLFLTRYVLGRAQRRAVREQALPPLDRNKEPFRKKALFW